MDRREGSTIRIRSACKGMIQMAAPGPFAKGRMAILFGCPVHLLVLANKKELLYIRDVSSALRD
jgi:hypothetical protein